MALQRRASASLFALVFALFAVPGCTEMHSEIEKQEDAAARVDYYEQAAKTYYDGERYEQSARMWTKYLGERPDDQWGKFGLAKALHMVGTPEALRQAEAVLVEIRCLDWCHPDRGDVRFEVETTLATVYSDLADFYSRDMRLLQSRLANDPNANAAELGCQIAAQKKNRDQLLQSSIPIWGGVLSCSPDNPYALGGLAKAHLLAGTEEAGVRYAQRFISLSRQSQVRWRQRLCEWEKESGCKLDREQRMFFLAKIHGAREKEIGMHLLLGSVFMRRDQFSQAVTEYDAILAMDEAIPAAYVERGQAYAAMGLYSKAVTDLEQYLQMTDPENQRRARVNAADLLDRYRRLAERQPQPRARGGYRSSGRAVAPTRRYVSPSPRYAPSGPRPMPCTPGQTRPMRYAAPPPQPMRPMPRPSGPAPSSRPPNADAWGAPDG